MSNKFIPIAQEYLVSTLSSALPRISKTKLETFEMDGIGIIPKPGDKTRMSLGASLLWDEFIRAFTDKISDQLEEATRYDYGRTVMLSSIAFQLVLGSGIDVPDLIELTWVLTEDNLTEGWRNFRALRNGLVALKEEEGVEAQEEGNEVTEELPTV